MDGEGGEAEKIAQINGVSEEKIAELILDAAAKSDEFDRRMLSENDGSAIPLAENEQLQNIMSAEIKQTNGACANLVKTLGFAERNAEGQVVYSSLGDFLIKRMDAAHMKVVNGVTDYNTAVRQACGALAASGVRTVYYNSGRSDRIEVAVRRAVLTSVSQVTQRISEQNAEELGADGWEISAHSGARPSHAIYQGRQFPAKDYDRIVKPLIEDYNCRHSAFPIILGVSEPVYTDKELAEMDKPVTYEGRTYTTYEAQQQMRKMERAMRKQKDRCIVADAAGDKDGFTAASIKLRRQKDIYEDFCRQTGSYTEYERTFVAGYNRHLAGKTGAVTRKRRAFDRAQVRLTDGGEGGKISNNNITGLFAKLPPTDNIPAFSNEDLKQIETELQRIPQKHRNVIEQTVKNAAIAKTSDGGYNASSKTLKLKPGLVSETLIHECGHILADAYKVYDDPEFIDILCDGLDLDPYSLTPIYYEPKKDYLYFVSSEKFVTPYQGRCYIDINTVDYGAKLSPKAFEEYISVGYETYFNNPELLRKKDPKLFDYIERKMIK